MEITFTHTGGATDWVYVLRDNGTPLRWPWPSLGATLPRDLVHYLVETRLGVRHGFWGLVADGTNFGYLSFAVDQIRAGLPPSRPADGTEVDLGELTGVECVIDALEEDAQTLEQLRRACTERAVPVPAALEGGETGEKALAELRGELEELTSRWRALAAGRSLVLSYSR